LSEKKEKWTMKKIRLFIALMLTGVLLLTGCNSNLSVGELQNESQSVKLGDAESVTVEIEFGAGDLQVSGGAADLLEADFTYNVARLKPEVEYKNGDLTVKQPETKGFPVLLGIGDFRNEWDLRLSNDVPMDLRVNMGAGTNDLKLAGLSLTRLDINLGAGKSTVDLSGDWARDLDITIDSGAADMTVRLPSQIGVQVEVEAGPVKVVASSLTKEGNVYTNSAYGASDVTLQINLKAGVGRVRLEVKEAAVTTD